MKNFLLFVFGCAAAGYCLYFVIVGNIFNLQGFWYIFVVLLALVICALVIYLLSFLLIREKKREAPGFDFGLFAPGEDKAAALGGKIEGYAEKIRELNAYIDDAGISNELSQIEEIMRKMRPMPDDETMTANRRGQLSEFFECYMPVIVKILNSYTYIEKNKLKGGNAEETKTQISKIMPVIRKGFEKELDNMFTDEMVDITADVKVLESMLSKDGLTDVTENR